MKYIIFNTVSSDSTNKTYVTVQISEESFTTFEADKSNPDYVQFLQTTQLTEAQVAALKPNTWYDFPKETN